MKKLVLITSFLFWIFSVSAQLLSPQQFLGYTVGTHFTPCNKIDDYFKAVAAAKPNMVKVEKYGQTYEGRDLMLAYIGLPENLQRLEEIRKNNLRLTGMLKDGVARKQLVYQLSCGLVITFMVTSRHPQRLQCLHCTLWLAIAIHKPKIG